MEKHGSMRSPTTLSPESRPPGTTSSTSFSGETLTLHHPPVPVHPDTRVSGRTGWDPDSRLLYGTYPGLTQTINPEDGMVSRSSTRSFLHLP